MKKDAKLILGLISIILVVVGALYLFRTPNPAHIKENMASFYEGEQSQNIQTEKTAQYWRIDWFVISPLDDITPNSFFSISVLVGGGLFQDTKYNPYSGKFSGTFNVGGFGPAEIYITSNVKWHFWIFAA